MFQSHLTRPLGVTLIAILLALDGILAIVQSLALLSAPLAFILTLVFGLVLLYLAFAMWKLQPWAWMATLVLEGLNAIFAILAIITAPGAIGAWISLIIAAVIVYYLTRPEVHAAFGHGRPVA